MRTKLSYSLLLSLLTLARCDASLPGTGPGGSGPVGTCEAVHPHDAPVPSEERALERIRALAPILKDQQHPIDQRKSTIKLITAQGEAGPIAREEAVAALGGALAPSHDSSVNQEALAGIAHVGCGSRRVAQVVGQVFRTTDNKEPVRSQAVEVLRKAATSDNLGEVLEVLSKVVHPVVHPMAIRMQAADAMFFHGSADPRVVSHLSQVLADSNHGKEMRERIVGYLSQVTQMPAKKAAVAGLFLTVTGPVKHDESLQGMAMQAVFRSHPDLALTHASDLSRVLNAQNNPISVRLTVLDGLGQLPPDQEPTLLLSTVGAVFTSNGHDTSVYLRAIGVVVRSGKGSRLAEEIVEQVARNASLKAEVRAAAQSALQELYRP